MNKTVAIIGAGRVGSAVGLLLTRAGYRITFIMTRSIASATMAAGFMGAGEPTTDVRTLVANADIVFLTTPDRAIRDMCIAAAKSGGLRPGTVVVHMSGAHTLDLLDAARSAGAYRAVVHPLQAVPSRQQGVANLPGSFFRIEADPEADVTARQVVAALGGRELKLSRWRSDRDSASLYHAGAVAVSNFFVALVSFGLRYYEVLGADRDEALRAVLPLIKGTIDNMESLGVPRALTGPIDRGDSETIRGHLDAMRRKAPELLPLYGELTRQTVSAAREKGSITEDKANEILALLKDGNQAGRAPVK